MSQNRTTESRAESEASPNGKSLIEAARNRISEERRLSSSSGTACYAAASLGQSPYVSLPGVGIIVVQKSGWGC